MPRIDSRSGDIVIRIVYDGMPEAGKTTNVQQLFGSIPLQRRGALASPDAKGRRTEFFDWLDFAGGFVDGRRVRCQLVSVPGQPQLLHRRKYLLESADAVVFVADSRPTSAEENRACLAQLVELLGSFGGGLPAAIVVQANKQDLEGALRPRPLAQLLEVPVVTPVVPAVAQAGRGVMDTFVLATRLATDRVRALMLDGAELDFVPDTDGSPDALHAAMVALEQAPVAPAPRTVTHERAQSLLRTRANDVATAKACDLPRPETLLAGHVWPPVKGRAAVAAAAAGTFVIPERALDWGPADPIEIGLDPGWVLHSSARWFFTAEGDARSALMTSVRRHAAHADLVPEGRAIFVAPDGGGHRLWVLTPEMDSLAHELLAAMVANDEDATARLRDAATTAAATLQETRGTPTAAGGACGVAIRNGRVLLLAVEEGGDPVDEHARRLVAHALEHQSNTIIPGRGE